MNHSTILGRAIALTLSLCAVASAQTPLRIGLSFDTGGKNDKSFNQASWVGAQRAAKEFGVKISNFEPNESSQVGQGIRTFAKAGHDLVIGVGFANNGPIQDNAKTYPGQKFAVVDDLPKGANTTGLRFAEEQGSFLVGFIAGNSTSTGVVGFVGGMDIPLIHKFEAGYKAGVRAACPTCKVVSQYVGTTPSAWNDPAKARQIASSQAAQGADIFFAAAGGSGSGVQKFVMDTRCVKSAKLPAGVKFNGRDVAASVRKPADYTASCSAADRPMFFIGVDSNQNHIGDSDRNPATMNYGLTSMVKRVDVAVYNTIRDLVQGTPWRTGERHFALANDGVGFALDEYNRALLSPKLQRQVELVRKNIISGLIKVPKQ